MQTFIHIPRGMPFLSVVGLLLLLTYCAGGCLAAAPVPNQRCSFDEVMRKSGPLPTAVVREVPRKGQGAMQAYTAAAKGESKDWAHIRIVVSMEDLKNPEKYCDESAVRNKGTKRPDFLGKEKACHILYFMTAEKVKQLTENIIPAAVKLHTERLRVHPLSAPLIVPQFAGGNSICKHYTIPPQHQSQGVPNADMVLYVSAGPGLHFGVPCATVNTERPVVGALNFIPYSYGGLRINTRVAAHEIAHALGFGYNQMRALGMVTETTVTQGVAPQPARVTSPTVLKKAKEHYNCKTLEGVDMNVEKYGGIVDSHWLERLAKDELMSDTSGVGAYLYTALTLAAFQDMKFYKADFGMAEPMIWGNNSGCGLFSGSCLVNGKSAYPNMFCDELGFRCTADRTSYGTCAADRDPKTKLLRLEGDCPTVNPATLPGKNGPPFASVCSEDLTGFFPHMLAGDNSWCLDGDSLTVPPPVSVSPNATPKGMAAEGVCVQVRCEMGKVKVKYRGNNVWHMCPEGQSITPQSEYFKSGKIKCPKYEEVCTIAANGSSLVIRRPEDDSVGVRTAGSLLLLVIAALTVLME